MNELLVAVDFDSTLCLDAWPEIGTEVPYAFQTLHDLQEANHRLMLWTMRGHKNVHNRNTLQEAIDWCADRGIEFWSHNENPVSKVWSSSNKQLFDICIDDRNLGTPLIHLPHISPFVDWLKIREMLYAQNILIPPSNPNTIKVIYK